MTTLAGKVLNVYLWDGRKGGGAICPGCGGPTTPGYGLPMLEGRIVPHSWMWDWCGVDCCEACWRKNEQANKEKP